MKRRLAVRVVALAGIPLVSGILWLASGREILTKSSKNVEVAVRDELFGDTIVQARAVPGPVLGYYVGLDAVALTAAGAVALGLIWWWLSRRTARVRAAAEKEVA